jgi:squalene-associated FAD-dependent desaturase
VNIAVIGAGWAGLSAAVALRRGGHAVNVFEASRTAGGRARRAENRMPGVPLDNGQHILLGAYARTLALMRELGLCPEQLFHRLPLDLRSADGRFRLRAAPLPAPLHLLAGLARAQGLGIAERFGVARGIARLRLGGWHTEPGLSVSQWLDAHRQSGQARAVFWRPLCLAALNTPPEEACAQLFANVLRDSVGGDARACDILIPATDLSSLWPDHAVALLASPPGSVQLGHAERSLASGSDGVLVDGMRHDAAIVACNTPSALRLLAQLPAVPGSAQYLECLAAFDFVPIATLTLQLQQPWAAPARMQLLCDAPERLEYGQWLFVDGRLAHIVVSDARDLQEQDPKRVIDAMIGQLRRQAGRALPEIAAQHLIVEKRATFRARPGLSRPANATPWQGVWVAGDWTDTGYPGVLEGAVRSGEQAAKQASTQGA